MKDESINAVVIAQELVQAYLSNEGLNEAPLPIPVLPAHPPVSDHTASASGLPEVISKVRNFDLTISRSMGIRDNIDAYFLRWIKPDRVRIMYSSSLDLASARLCICKELAHVALGHESNFTSSAERVRVLITELINDDIVNDDPDLIVEHVAYHAAIEMLMPFQLQSHLRDCIEHQAGFNQIAASFGVPEYLVEFRCLKDVNDLFNEAYKKAGLIT